MKQTIIDMRHNASGIRDTARVLRISTDTVLRDLKKKKQCWSRCIPHCYVRGTRSRLL